MPEPARPVITAATRLANCGDAILKISCSNCRRHSALACRDLAGVHGRDLKLWRMVERLRCSQCGAEPASVELLQGADTAPSPRSIGRVRLL